MEFFRVKADIHRGHRIMRWLSFDIKNCTSSGYIDEKVLALIPDCKS